MALRGRDVSTAAPATGRTILRRAPFLSCAGLLLAIGFLAVGCADDANSRPASRPNSLLNDPFNYKPDMSDMDISGGDIGHYSKKGMKHDWDILLNP